jgi:hypothetical protein
MPLDVIHGRERHPKRQRQGMGEPEADQERSNKTGSAGGRDGVDFTEGDAGFVEGSPGDRGKKAEMGPGGDFGYDAVVLQVFRLRGNDAGQDLPAGLDDGRRSLITGRFDAENSHGGTSMVALPPLVNRRRRNGPGGASAYRS